MGRVGDNFQNLERRQEQRDAKHFQEIMRRMQAGDNIDEALESTHREEKTDVSQALHSLNSRTNSPLSETLIEIPDSKQKMHEYSANNIAGYLLGRRISAIAPESKKTTKKERADFVKGLVAGMSMSVLKDFADEKQTGLKVQFGKGLENLKTNFSALKQAAKGDHNQNWFSKDLVSSKLSELTKLRLKDFTRITGLDAVGKEVYKNISKFWDIVASKNTDRDPEVILAAI